MPMLTLGASWMFPARESRSIQKKYIESAPLEVQTKHDQTAALLGLLSASGLSIELLMSMGEEKRKETLMVAATIRNSTRLTAQERMSLKQQGHGHSSLKQEHLSLKKTKPMSCRFIDESGPPVTEKGEDLKYLLLFLSSCDINGFMVDKKGILCMFIFT